MSYIDWYDRRDELEPSMVFDSCWGIVQLDRRVPGDGSRWYVLDGRNSYNTGKWGWYAEDSTIEPGDLTERLPNDYAGEPINA